LASNGDNRGMNGLINDVILVDCLEMGVGKIAIYFTLFNYNYSYQLPYRQYLLTHLKCYNLSNQIKTHHALQQSVRKKNIFIHPEIEFKR
jgi:hypothetical protein